MEVIVKSLGERLVVLSSPNFNSTFNKIKSEDGVEKLDSVNIAQGKIINSVSDLKKFYRFMKTKVKCIRYTFIEFKSSFDMSKYNLIIFYNDPADNEFTLEFKNTNDKGIARMW